MPREEWRPAPGWAAYEVSDRGRVRSVDRKLASGRTVAGRLLRQSRDKDGYRYVTLASGAERWRVHVGRLVLFTFAGWPDRPDLEACHGNGRRWDNRLANLRWDDRPANRADRERHRAGRRARLAANVSHLPVTKMPPRGEKGTAEWDSASADLEAARAAEIRTAGADSEAGEGDTGVSAPCPMNPPRSPEENGR